MTSPVFRAPVDTRYCGEQVRLRSDAVIKCDLEAHEGEVHYDEDEDLYWSLYPVEEA